MYTESVADSPTSFTRSERDMLKYAASSLAWGFLGRAWTTCAGPRGASKAATMTRATCRKYSKDPFMKHSLLAIVLMAAALTVAAPDAHAQGGWTVTNLHPAGATESRAEGGFGTQQVGHYRSEFVQSTAALWSGTAASLVFIRSIVATHTAAFGSSGTQQVGYDRVGGVNRALLWSGTADSRVSLHPAGPTDSYAYGISGTQQVGAVIFFPYDYRASLWSGTAASWVNLHPAGPTDSWALATSGTQQVGQVFFGAWERASLWSGTAASWVDLHPAGATNSAAYGISGTQQVGWVQVGGADRASLWSGTAASWVDLHPTGSTYSEARGTTGTQQVGNAYVGGVTRASLWSGTAGSWEDLSLALPGGPSAWGSTSAQGIWSDGSSTFVAGYGENIATNRNEALLWSRPLSTCDGPVANWALNGDALDSSGEGNHGAFSNEVFIPGVQGPCLQLGDPGIAYAVFPDSPSLNPATAITVAGWYRGPIFAGDGNNGLVSKVGDGALPYQYHLGVIGQDYSAFGAGFNFDVTTTDSGWVTAAAHGWDPDVWYHVVGTYDGAAVNIYVNGVLQESVPATGTIPSFGGPVYVGQNAYSGSLLPGDADEVLIYNRALSAAEIEALYLLQRTGLPVSPDNATVCPGDSGSFTVSVPGTDPATYQWRKDGTPIDPLTNASAETATLLLINLQAADAGSYDCLVGTPCGGPSLTSNPATLTICTGPFENSLWLGTDNSATLSVLNTDRAGNVLRQVVNTEATGIAIDPAAGLIYFSDHDGQITTRDLNDPGTILSTLNVPTAFSEDMAFDGASLWRVDTSAATVEQIDPATGNILSSFVTDFTPLGIAWDGTSLWVSEFAADGMVKQFTTAGVATGNEFIPPLGGNTTGGLAFDTTDGTLWIGAYDTVYHTTTDGTLLGSFDAPGRFIDGLEIHGAIIDPCVGQEPVFTQQPQSTAACPTGAATFSITASGTEPFTYQWEIEDPSAAPVTFINLVDGPIVLGGVLIGTSSGATTGACQMALVPSAISTNRVRCIVSNDCGSATSDESTLSICIGDADCDQDTDSDDIVAFFTAWDQGEPGGDTDGDGDTDSDDIIVFFAAWDSGC